MNEEQYKQLLAPAQEKRLSATMLTDRSPRTLIWGFDVDRNSFHVYLAEDKLLPGAPRAVASLHVVQYAYEGYLLKHLTEEDAKPEDYVPNKRVYPEACDFEFCQLLKNSGVRIPFTSFSVERKPATYHGKKLEELIFIPADYKVPEVTLEFDDFDFPEDSFIHMTYGAREDFESMLPGRVREMMLDFDRRVRFARENPQDFPQRIERRVESFAYRDFEHSREFPEELRYTMSVKARETIVSRVMAVLEDAYAQ